MILKKGTDHSANYLTLAAHMKINQISYGIFQAISFPWNFASPFSVMTQNSSEIFLLNYYPLDKKNPIKVQVLRLLWALMKVHPIPHVSFETTRLSIGYIRLSTPLKNTTPSFLPSSPLKLSKPPLFRQSIPLYQFFVNPQPLNIRVFILNPKIFLFINFFSH